MSAFSKTHSAISLNLIRNVSSKKSDDTITIRPTFTEGVVHLLYKDSVNDSKHEVRLTNDELCHYFVSLFHVMSYDTDPFESVQVNCPAFPCVLLSVKDLGDESLRMRLQSMIQLTLKTSFVKMDDDDEALPPLTKAMPPLETCCETCCDRRAGDCECY